MISKAALSGRTETSEDRLSAKDRARQDLEAAHDVLDKEAAGLSALRARLDGTFSRAVDILAATTGRVVVSGMGKSGHVARKIAATMASTGTPAQFIHPAEASHGDLGMITPQDCVLMLSNSGETKELADLIQHTRRYSIALIGIASKPDSSLLREADVGLVLPPMEEACPMGLAPTTSTTVSLALGDALSVALMRRKGFTSDDYRMLHPGGQLGKSLMRVEDIMHVGPALPLVTETAPMKDVIHTMTSGSFGCAGVVDADGRLVGIITDGDLRRHTGDGSLFEQDARTVMTTNPKTIRPRALAAEAVNVINESRITVLFVTEEGGTGETPIRQKPIGILHIHDCLRAGWS